MKTTTTLIALSLILGLVPLSGRSVKAEESLAAQQARAFSLKRAQAVSNAQKVGYLPALGELESRLYSGPCSLPYSSVDPMARHYGFLHFRKVNGEIWSHYSLALYSPMDPFLARAKSSSLDALAAAYPVHRLTRAEKNFLRADIAMASDEAPILYYLFNEFIGSDHMTLIASHVGLVYCVLDRLR